MASSPSLAAVSMAEINFSFPFMALYGRENDRRSTFLCKYILQQQQQNQQQQQQCIFLLDGHRSKEFAQTHHSTELFSPFLEDLQALLGNEEQQQEKVAFETVHTWGDEITATQPSNNTSKPFLIIEDRSASHQNEVTPLGKYLSFLQPLIGKNNQAGVRTLLVIDDIWAFANLDLQSPEDLQTFLEEFVNKRSENQLSIFMAPKLQLLDKLPEIAQALDVVLFADHAITYRGMKSWQQVFFRPFGEFTSDEALVSLFDEFREEREERFQALVIYKGVWQSVGSNPLYLAKLSVPL